MTNRKSLRALTLGLLIAATGCGDFFYDAGTAPGLVVVAIDAPRTFSASSSAASTGVAFDKLDQVAVVVRSGEQTLYDQTVDLEGQGAERKVDIELELEGEVSLTVAVELLSQGRILFTGSDSRTVSPGVATTFEPTMTPVAAGLSVEPGTVVLPRVGATQQMSASTVFETGDVIESVDASWGLNGGGASISSDGLLTALAAGSGEVSAQYQSLGAEATYSVMDPCSMGLVLEAYTPTAGTLDPETDCLGPEAAAVRDLFLIEIPQAVPHLVTYAATGFDPLFFLIDDPGRIVAARGGDDASTVFREFIFPAGDYGLWATSYNSDANSPPGGSYALNLSVPTEAQVGCIGTTTVLAGVSTSGQLTGDDCEDLHDGQPEIVRRWDGFSAILDGPATSITATVTADLYIWFSHWIGDELVEVVSAPPDHELVLTGSAQDGLFHQFYVITAYEEGRGSYTISFDGPGASPGTGAGVTRNVTGAPVILEGGNR